MALPASADRAEIFAANRARGRLALSVASRAGVTRRARVREEGSLRVRFPGPSSADLDAVIVNTAGGIAGGDRFDLDVSVGEGARLAVTTAAAEKIYRSLAPDAAIRVAIDVAANGALLWLPQETILFDRARLRRTIDVDLAPSATLVLVEGLVFGRTTMSETVRQGSVFDCWRVRVAGRLCFAETVRLDGAVADRLKEPAVAAGGTAIASLLMVPADQNRIDTLRAVAASFQGEFAASAWNGFALARFVAADGMSLRHDVARGLAALAVPLPRLWLH
jgi:urease accessory protein